MKKPRCFDRLFSGPLSAGSATRAGRWLVVYRHPAWLAAGALLACGCAAADFEPWPEPDSSADQAVLSAATAGKPRSAQADELDALRNNAAVGDEDSAVRLAQVLVDRYEADRAPDELFEAVLWIDRFHGTESLARSGVVARVSQKHCDEKVLRFHWLCAAAE